MSRLCWEGDQGGIEDAAENHGHVGAQKGAQYPGGRVRRRGEELRLAFSMDEEVVKEHAEWRGQSLMDMWAASSSPPLESADADCCNTSLLFPSEVQGYAASVQEATDLELAARRKFDVFRQVKEVAP